MAAQLPANPIPEYPDGAEDYIGARCGVGSGMQTPVRWDLNRYPHATQPAKLPSENIFRLLLIWVGFKLVLIIHSPKGRQYTPFAFATDLHRNMPRSYIL